ncbi:NADH-quinone oxidoreductase subunit M [Budvicia aquatica]|nr:NADH-quinone oxidoreductase subunit M [Budvicia aquatica]
MNLRELLMVMLLVVLLILLGVYPQPILDTSYSAVSTIQKWFSAAAPVYPEMSIGM